MIWPLSNGMDSFQMCVSLPGGPASPCGPGKPAGEEEIKHQKDKCGLCILPYDHRTA